MKSRGDRTTILVVEDEPAIADTILYALEREGFTPLHSTTCAAARSHLEAERVDLVVLDVGLPDGSGFEFCKEIRRRTAVPIIFLTARSSEIDRVVGLEIGADDYVSKPFSPRELAARIKAVLRRVRAGSTEVTNSSVETPSICGPLCHDPLRCQVTFHGETLDLTRYEYRLLTVFIDRPGQVFSRRQLMQLAWEEPDISLERTVDSHIKSLRAKLRRIAREDPIVTHRGIGYSLKDYR
jgi:two-component system catabolic regulation response regulator CreB